MSSQSNLVPVDWIVERGDRDQLERSRQLVGNIPFVMPYFDTEGGNIVYGLIGTGFGDGQMWGLRPSARFNASIMSLLREWQSDGLRLLRNRQNKTSVEIRRALAEQIFISSGLAVAGAALLECKADVPTTNFIRNGLKELRSRIHQGYPPSGEVELLYVLLTNADCPRVHRGSLSQDRAA